MKKWNQILNGSALNTDEQTLLKAWEDCKTAENSFAAFQVLKNHGFAHEASELLSWALVFQPEDFGLRVKIAREFFELGLIQDAWDSLYAEISLSEKHGDALNILFLCSLILAKEKEAHFFLYKLELESILDPLASRIQKVFHSLGFEASRRALQQHFQDRRLYIELEASYTQQAPLKRSPLQQFHFKNGICSLHLSHSEEQDLLETRERAQRWKRLERNEQKLDYLRLLKRQLART